MYKSYDENKTTNKVSHNTVYGIASKTTTCCGHGDFREEEQIVNDDSYGFPPCFKYEEDAKKYLSEMKCSYGKIVVPISYIEN